MLCFSAHATYLLCAAISYLQLSAVLLPQAIKLVLLINLNLSVLFLTLWKCSNSSEIKKKNRISNNNKPYKIPTIII